jgi:type I restriction enzyme S subunit
MRSKEGWRRLTLGDCAVWLSGGTPNKRTPEFWNGDIPWISSKELHSRFIDDAEFKVTELGVASGSRTVPPEATLLVVRSMALEKGMMVGLTRRTVAFNQDVKGLIARPGIDPHFLYYSLWGNEDKLNGLVDEASHGTKRLNTDQLQAFEIRVPELMEQQLIARFFRALDDKIESNRRITTTLEEMAAALFKSEFIDFVGHDDLVESDIGPIPRGWSLLPLDQVSAVLTRGRAPVYVDEEGTLVLNQKCVREGRVMFEVARRHDEQARSSEDRRVEVADVLINSTGVGTLGRVSQVRWLPEPATVDGHVTLVRAATPDVIQDYLALSLMSRQAELEGMAHGSTGQTELTRSRLAEMAILVPPREKQDLLRRFYEPIREKIGSLERENIALSGIRDALLPKLVSGEVEVSRTLLAESAT